MSYIDISQIVGHTLLATHEILFHHKKYLIDK